MAKKLSESARSSKARVLDLCCGVRQDEVVCYLSSPAAFVVGSHIVAFSFQVGISTRALREAFPESDLVAGVDTSPEMITMANFLNTHLGFFKPIAEFFANLQKIRCSKVDPRGQRRQPCFPKFSKENAEQTRFPSQSFELVTLFYAFHEAPKEGRDRILREAYRVLQPGGTLAVVDICTDYTPSDPMLAGEPYVLEYQKNINNQLRSMRGFSNVRYETIVPKHVGMWILKRSSLEL